MKPNLGYKEWLAKYFPAKPSPKMTWEEAVTHSIQKWSGAYGKILERYNADKGGSCTIYFAPTQKPFHFAKDTCALCVKTGLERKDCDPCPLYHVRGRVICSEKMMEEMDSPYEDFLDYDDPASMLRWLRATRLFLKTKKWREIVAQNEANKKQKGF